MSEPMLRFLCLRCRQPLEARADKAGNRATCHACGQEMRVPRITPGETVLRKGDPIEAAPPPAPGLATGVAPAPSWLPTPSPAVPKPVAPPPTAVKAGPARPTAAVRQAVPTPAKAEPRTKPWAIVLAIAGIGGFGVLVVGIVIVGLLARFLASRTEPPSNAEPTPTPIAAVDPNKDKQPVLPKDDGPPAKDKEKSKEKPPEKEKEEPKPAPNPSKNPDGTPKLDIKVIETVIKEEKTEPKKFRLAITPPAFDDMGKLLRTLGDGYKFTDIADFEILNSTRLQDIDVLFLTCNSSDANNKQMNANLRKFVEQGGTLYASDLRFDALRGAFPEYIDATKLYAANPQNMTADIAEPGLQEALGSKTIQLHFNGAGWRTAAFKRDKATVYLEGNINLPNGKPFFTPLLVKFSYGKGAVIYTSFHNAAQNSETEKKLLKYLVFTAVTSQNETRIATTMIKGGFSPQVSRLLNASDPQQATSTYVNKKAGPLSFMLGFANQGARFRLTLIAPDKQKFEKEGTSTFGFEIPNAPAGDWQYTVTALELPYANFPFTLTVGEKAAK